MRRRTKLLLAAAALALVALPTVLATVGIGIGTDNRAVAAVGASQPGYEPWFHALWRPPAWLEAPLFGLQIAIGLALIGGCFWLLRRRAAPSARNAGEEA